jgi:hypothetical protein
MHKDSTCTEATTQLGLQMYHVPIDRKILGLQGALLGAAITGTINHGAFLGNGWLIHVHL